jgi:uncharacterized protein YdeI (YjbR/CyaY-like superfamily)
MEPIYFSGPEAFRAWLEEHHADATDVLIGFHKRGSGRPSLTWPESVDEALCYGWIDGIRRRVDETRYTIRFTPRKTKSNWSAINIDRVAELEKLGRMRPAGRTAFALRDEARSRIYAYERKNPQLPPELTAKLRAHKKAWAFYSAQPSWYQRTTAHWVISAKKEETRLRRFATLVECSAEGKNIPPLTPARPKGRKS